MDPSNNSFSPGAKTSLPNLAGPWQVAGRSITRPAHGDTAFTMPLFAD